MEDLSLQNSLADKFRLDVDNFEKEFLRKRFGEFLKIIDKVLRRDIFPYTIRAILQGKRYVGQDHEIVSLDGHFGCHWSRRRRWRNSGYIRWIGTWSTADSWPKRDGRRSGGRLRSSG